MNRRGQGIDNGGMRSMTMKTMESTSMVMCRDGIRSEESSCSNSMKRPRFVFWQPGSCSRDGVGVGTEIQGSKDRFGDLEIQMISCGNGRRRTFDEIQLFVYSGSEKRGSETVSIGEWKM